MVVSVIFFAAGNIASVRVSASMMVSFGEVNESYGTKGTPSEVSR